MKTIEELKHLLTIEPCSEVQEIENTFHNLAYELINNYGIEKRGVIYRFIEIEFYHNKTDMGATKEITYRRIAEAGEWFFHPSGIDLTFNSNNESYGGILIRSIKCGDKFICGPHNVEFELFDKFNALADPDNFPIIVPLQSPSSLTPLPITRFNIEGKKLYGFCVPKDNWPRPGKQYQAYPWYYNNVRKR